MISTSWQGLCRAQGPEDTGDVSLVPALGEHPFCCAERQMDGGSVAQEWCLQGTRKYTTVWNRCPLGVSAVTKQQDWSTPAKHAHSAL